MLALRLSQGAPPAVRLRRLAVALASAGTGFLLLCVLGYALAHPDDRDGSLLRLAWCLTPLAATVHLAAAVSRTDPGTRPRPGLSAIGLGPVRLMAVAAAGTALSCALGSLAALLVFLHLRGDLTGMPFDGAAAEFLAAGQPLPLPAALTLLALVPAAASVTVALLHRPPDTRTPAARRAALRHRFGAVARTPAHETFGSYGRFGARLRRPDPADRPSPRRAETAGAADGDARAGEDDRAASAARDGHGPARGRAAVPYGSVPGQGTETAGPTPGAAPASGADRDTAAGVPAETGEGSGGTAEALHAPDAPEPHDLTPHLLAPHVLPAGPRDVPRDLPWGVAVLAAGLAVEAYAARLADARPLTMPGGLSAAPLSVLVGWLLTAAGLVLVAPGLTHLCGRLLQSVRPGALRLLAGRVLMAEAVRVGRPLGVVCAVASAAYAMTELHAPGRTAFGPLTTLGTVLVAGCTLATLLTAAVEARQARADTTAALVRLGAPAGLLRGAAALRAGALLVLFVPLTLTVAELAALPLGR